MEMNNCGRGNGFCCGNNGPVTNIFYSCDTCMRDVIERVGGNVNIRDGNGRTVLHLAAHRGGFTFRKIMHLVEHGADVNAEDNEGDTPLYSACFRLTMGFNLIQTHLRSWLVNYLISKGADLYHVNRRTGRTPLDVLKDVLLNKNEMILEGGNEWFSEVSQLIENLDSSMMIKEPDCS